MANSAAIKKRKDDCRLIIKQMEAESVRTFSEDEARTVRGILRAFNNLTERIYKSALRDGTLYVSRLR